MEPKSNISTIYFLHIAHDGLSSCRQTFFQTFTISLRMCNFILTRFKDKRIEDDFLTPFSNNPTSTATDQTGLKARLNQIDS